MNRRQFLQGFAAIAAASPFAAVLAKLPEKEIYQPTPHTMIAGAELHNFIQIETPIIDIYLPHDGDDEYINLYVQNLTGHTMYIGSGQPGTIIQCAQITPEPFRLVSDAQAPDKSQIIIKPRYYQFNDDNRAVRTIQGESIHLIARTFSQ